MAQRSQRCDRCSGAWPDGSEGSGGSGGAGGAGGSGGASASGASVGAGAGGAAVAAAAASPAGAGSSCQLGLRKRRNRYGGSRPISTVPARISRTYPSVLPLLNCDGGTKPMITAAAEAQKPVTQRNLSAGAT